MGCGREGRAAGKGLDGRGWWQGDVSGPDDLDFLEMVVHVHGEKYLST